MSDLVNLTVCDRSDMVMQLSQHRVNARFFERPESVLGAWTAGRGRNAPLVVRWDRGGVVLDEVCRIVAGSTSFASSAIAVLSETRSAPHESLEFAKIDAEKLRTALVESLNTTGRIDLNYIALRLQVESTCVRAALLDAGLCFVPPVGCASHLHDATNIADLVAAPRYLSGDIVAKLRSARTGLHSANAEALRRVLPDKTGLSDIACGLGAAWIPAPILRDWLYSLFPGATWGLSLEHAASTWLLACTNPDIERADAALRTDNIRGIELLRAALNCRLPIVEAGSDTEDSDGDTNRLRHDARATMEAQLRVQELRASFEKWIASDTIGKSGQTSDARRQSLETAYAERFRRFAPLRDDGKWLDFPGLASVVDRKRYRLRPHQRRGIAKILAGGTYDRSALLPYPPGEGKTDAAICAAVKLHQQGRARRTLVVVPANAAGQWQARWAALYPGCEDDLLCSSDSELGVKRVGLAGFLRRASHLARPFIVATHSMLGVLGLSRLEVASVLEGEISDARHSLREAEALMSREAQTLCRAELRTLGNGARKTIEEATSSATSTGAKGLPTWADLGVDHLIVDELQYFKSLPVRSHMAGYGGMSTRESTRAVDLWLKCGLLLMGVGGLAGRVTALTGTPLTNSLTEAHTWMRVLQPRLLREMELTHFDAWASVFCEPYAGAEMDCTGRFRSRARLRFRNVPELLAMLGEAWDFGFEDIEC